MSTLFFPIFPWVFQVLVIGYFAAVALYVASIGNSTFKVVNSDNTTTNCSCSSVIVRSCFKSKLSQSFILKFVFRTRKELVFHWDLTKYAGRNVQAPIASSLNSAGIPILPLFTPTTSLVSFGDLSLSLHWLKWFLPGHSLPGTGLSTNLVMFRPTH